MCDTSVIKRNGEQSHADTAKARGRRAPRRQHHDYLALGKKGDFPQHIQLGSTSVGYLEDEVDNWLQARAENRYAA